MTVGTDVVGHEPMSGSGREADSGSSPGGDSVPEADSGHAARGLCVSPPNPPTMAPAEDDISIEEKRVYAGSAGRTDAYVATGSGVVRVALSADKIGAFDMVARDAAHDVAVLPRADAPDLLGVATDEGLLVAPVGDDLAFEAIAGVLAGDDVVDGDAADDDPGDRSPVVAVGAHDDAFLVAGTGGRIDRVTIDGSGTGGDAAALDATAIRVGEVEAPRAIDGPLVAAADGIHRIVERDEAGGGHELAAAGLDDAADVAGAGTPLAATGTGLYWLGNGWMSVREGSGEAVAADGDGHAMAVVDGELFVHDGDAAGWGSASWSTTTLPVAERAVALGYGPGTAVVVTDAGTLCVDAGDGWRHQVVGVRDVTGVALAVVE